MEFLFLFKNEEVKLLAQLACLPQGSNGEESPRGTSTYDNDGSAIRERYALPGSSHKVSHASILSVCRKTVSSVVHSPVPQSLGRGIAQFNRSTRTIPGCESYSDVPTCGDPP